MHKGFPHFVALLIVPALILPSFAEAQGTYQRLQKSVNPIPVELFGYEALMLAVESVMHNRHPVSQLPWGKALSQLKNQFVEQQAQKDASHGPWMLEPEEIPSAWSVWWKTPWKAATTPAFVAGALAGFAYFSDYSLATKLWGLTFGGSSAGLVWALKPEIKPPTSNAKAFKTLWEGIGEDNPDWARMNLLAGAILNAGYFDSPFSAAELQEKFTKDLVAHGLAQNTDAGHFLKRLFDAGVIKRVQDGAEPHYQLAVSVEVFAVKMRAASFIQRQFETAISRATNRTGRSDLAGLLENYANATENWPMYPVEVMYPILQAVSQLTQDEQENLIGFIGEDSNLDRKNPYYGVLRDRSLVDSIWLMLRKAPRQSFGEKSWVARNAPHLAGTKIYTVAPEGWVPAGGLGRVQQYHSVAMQSLLGLDAAIATIEPWYEDSDGDNREKFREWGPAQEITFPITPFAGLPVNVTALKYTVNGMDRYFIRAEPNDAYRNFDGTKKVWVGKRYNYREDQKNKDTTLAYYSDFSEFFSVASLELIRSEERQRRYATQAHARNPYKPPVIIANDGQMGALARIKREMYEDPMFHDVPGRSIMRDAVIWFVTHTYMNRGKYMEGDATTPGVRSADGASAVAAVHRDEVWARDTMARLLAITNGDNRAASRSKFLKIWKDKFPNDDDEHPTAQQVAQVNMQAKLDFTVPDDVLESCGLPPQGGQPILDPQRPVAIYAGRFVAEKSGRERALTFANLRFLAQQGVQAVLYGNVQAHTKEEFAKLLNEARTINREALESGGGGKIIVRTGWSLEDQRALLAAGDFQIQDSNRGTEAAGFTESNIAANGGLQVPPSGLEGILQSQGIILNRKIPGKGSTLVPASSTEMGYRKVYQWLIEQWTEDRENLHEWQATAVRLSRILEAEVPAGQYLRALSRAVHWREDPLEAVRAYVEGQPEVEKYFRHPFVRRALFEWLLARPEIATPLPVSGENGVRAFEVRPPGEGTSFILLLNTNEKEVDPNSELKVPSLISFVSDVARQALVRMVGKKAVADSTTDLSVWDPAKRQFYSSRNIGDILQHGWRVGVPSCGVQVLVPKPSKHRHSRLEKGDTARGENLSQAPADGVGADLYRPLEPQEVVRKILGEKDAHSGDLVEYLARNWETPAILGTIVGELATQSLQSHVKAKLIIDALIQLSRYRPEALAAIAQVLGSLPQDVRIRFKRLLAESNRIPLLTFDPGYANAAALLATKYQSTLLNSHNPIHSPFIVCVKGAPASGKTTFVRAMKDALTAQGLRVGVVDERQFGSAPMRYDAIASEFPNMDIVFVELVARLPNDIHRLDMFVELKADMNARLDRISLKVPALNFAQERAGIESAPNYSRRAPDISIDTSKAGAAIYSEREIAAHVAPYLRGMKPRPREPSKNDRAVEQDKGRNAEHGNWWKDPAVRALLLLPLTANLDGDPSPYLGISLFAQDAFQYVDPEQVGSLPHGLMDSPEGRARLGTFENFFVTEYGRDTTGDRAFHDYLENLRLKGLLDDVENYALFHALLDQNDGTIWQEWPEAYRDPHSEEVKVFKQEHEKQILAYLFQQWQFMVQFTEEHEAAHAKNLRFIGDLPLYPSKNSAEVWRYQSEIFVMNKLVGAPGVNFATGGQYRGSYPYRWSNFEQVMKFWEKRIRYAALFYDGVRIDHELGFFGEWQIDLGQPDLVNTPDAIGGNWTWLSPQPVENFGGIPFTVALLRGAFGILMPLFSTRWRDGRGMGDLTPLGSLVDWTANFSASAAAHTFPQESPAASSLQNLQSAA